MINALPLAILEGTGSIDDGLPLDGLPPFDRNDPAVTAAYLAAHFDRPRHEVLVMEPGRRVGGRAIDEPSCAIAFHLYCRTLRALGQARARERFEGKHDYEDAELIVNGVAHQGLELRESGFAMRAARVGGYTILVSVPDGAPVPGVRVAWPDGTPVDRCTCTASGFCLRSARTVAALGLPPDEIERCGREANEAAAA